MKQNWGKRTHGLLLVELMQCPGHRQAPTPVMLPSPGRPPLPSQVSQPIVHPVDATAGVLSVLTPHQRSQQADT